MGGEDQVTLHGTWESPFSFRVVWALKLKGIAYDFIEEDLLNKSDLLLQYNPVHKKIPVLVHGRKPICESMVIIEYIEEMWPHTSLLPTDRYDRATVRFWVKFAEDKGLAVWRTLRTTGEELEKAIKESMEVLQIVEEHGLGDKKYFNGEKIGTVDIAFGSMVYWLGVNEEVLGMKLFEPRKFPRLHRWFQSFQEVPVIKENLPNRDNLLVFYKLRREFLEASAACLLCLQTSVSSLSFCPSCTLFMGFACVLSMFYGAQDKDRGCASLLLRVQILKGSPFVHINFAWSPNPNILRSPGKIF